MYFVMDSGMYVIIFHSFFQVCMIQSASLLIPGLRNLLWSVFGVRK